MGFCFIHSSSYQSRIIAPVADRRRGQGDERIGFHLLSDLQLRAANRYQQSALYSHGAVGNQSGTVGCKALYCRLQILMPQRAQRLAPKHLSQRIRADHRYSRAGNRVTQRIAGVMERLQAHGAIAKR